MPVCVTQPRKYGWDPPHMIPPPHRPPCTRRVSLRNYHIHDGRGSGLAEAVQVAWIGGFNLMILMDTKIIYQAYCQNRMVYDAVRLKEITTADGEAKGEVVMISRNRPQVWSIELTRFHGPNMVSCEVVTRKWTPLIGAYTPPSGAPTGLGGGPYKILSPKPHIVRGPQCP